MNNLVLGPATLYKAAVGAAEPADTAVDDDPAAPWIDCGGTREGLTLVVNQTYTELEVDQIVDAVGRRLTKREIRLDTSLAEPTLENLRLSVNGAAAELTTGVGFAAWDPTTGNSATQPNYTALILDGWAPLLSDGTPATRRAILRKCLSVAEVNQAHTKDEQTVLAVSFQAHYVSSSVRPIHVVDQTAA